MRIFQYDIKFFWGRTWFSLFNNKILPLLILHLRQNYNFSSFSLLFPSTHTHTRTRLSNVDRSGTLKDHRPSKWNVRSATSRSSFWKKHNFGDADLKFFQKGQTRFWFVRHVWHVTTNNFFTSSFTFEWTWSDEKKKKKVSIFFLFNFPTIFNNTLKFDRILVGLKIFGS